MKSLININIKDIYRYLDGEIYALDSSNRISHNVSFIDDRGVKVISRIPGNDFRGKVMTASVVWYYFFEEYIQSFDYSDKNPLNTNVDNLLPVSSKSLNRKYKIYNTKNKSGLKYVFKTKDGRYIFYKYIFDDNFNFIRATNIKADNYEHAKQLSEDQIKFLKQNQWRI